MRSLSAHVDGLGMNVIWLVLFTFLFVGAPLYAHSPCEKCLKASEEELKRCLANTISQEDKISCADKQDAQAKICEQGECQAERAQRSKQSEVLPEKKQTLER